MKLRKSYGLTVVLDLFVLVYAADCSSGLGCLQTYSLL